MNTDLNDFLPSVTKEKASSSYSTWLEYKSVIDALKESGIISEYLRDLMSIYLREKLGLLIVK